MYTNPPAAWAQAAFYSRMETASENSQAKINAAKGRLEVRLPDTRGVTLSRWGCGNTKIGWGVVTYSKVAVVACPGSTPFCREICYAQRIGGPVLDVYEVNTAAGANVPDLPEDAELVRLHVSGDFDSVEYIQRWTQIVAARQDVDFWAYTRSWAVTELLPHLEGLRALPNMQLFASVDQDTGLPPDGWRIAWINGDARLEGTARKVLVCPEERKKVANCEECGYCFCAPKVLTDVVFLKH